ncbi:MAG: di-heme oxidoredictase family protein [Planctomycetota bacterium]
MFTILRGFVPLALAAGLLTACTGGGTESNVQVSTLGQAMDGITADQQAAFERGRALFSKRFGPSEGLGPLYNATSCESCHSTPVPGGSAKMYRNFYIAAVGFPGFQFALPGTPSVVVPAFGQTPHATSSFSTTARRSNLPTTIFGLPVAITQRNALPTFGVGLFETISDATILANADPDDLDGDGISGRGNYFNGGLGRFGTKAQSNNLEQFTRGPLNNQMGITSNPFQGTGATVSLGEGRLQVGADPTAPLVDMDGVPDPEISEQDLSDLIAFARFLAPPRKKAFSAEATQGEQLFGQIGCTKCHIPALQGTDGPVEAYTDLLLHDMGPGLADGVHMPGTVPQASSISLGTTESEWRTQPLWGVSMSAPFLHDGRAETLDEAILLHGGEAQTIRDTYVGLSDAERAAIIAFLEAL